MNEERKEALQRECIERLRGLSLGGGKMKFLPHGFSFPVMCDEVVVGQG